MFLSLQRGFILVMICALFWISCSVPTPNSSTFVPDTVATYFPIRRFILGEAYLLSGQPYTLERTTILNGKRDTGLVALYDVPWGGIMKDFLAADIGHPRFMDQYRVSSFFEESTNTDQLFYEAIDPKLFTRLMTVGLNHETKRPVSIYAETASGNTWSHRVQKLYYAPLKIVQIQEFVTSRMGPDKSSRVEYKFQRSRDDDYEL
jgi:hypothetical protein